MLIKFNGKYEKKENSLKVKKMLDNLNLSKATKLLRYLNSKHPTS